VSTLGTGGAVPLMLDYLYWLRDRVLAACGTLEGGAFLDTRRVNTRDLRSTLLHELDVEIGWRARLRGDPPEAWGPESELEMTHYPTLASIANHWQNDEVEMRGWLSGLGAGALEQPVTHNRLEGYPLAVYVLHMVEHGVQEFTNAGAILTELGRSPGDMNLLDALDELRPLPRLEELES
jgi:uncharacterized damage-inducible protein DinB